MSVALRSFQPVNGDASSSTFTATEPAGAAQNDILLMYFLLETEAAIAETYAAPSGWTQLAKVNTNGTTNIRFSSAIYAIRRGSSAPSYGVTNIDTAAPTFYVEAVVSSWSGVDTGVAMSSLIVADTGNQSGNPANPDSPSVITTVNNSVVVSLGPSWAGASSIWSPPSGYTIGDNGSAFGEAPFAYKLVATAGAENPGAFSGAASGVDPWWAVSVVLPPAAGASGFFGRPYYDMIGAAH